MPKILAKTFKISDIIGAHAERSHSWPSALAWKASIPHGIAGSNPALSASTTFPGGFYF